MKSNKIFARIFSKATKFPNIKDIDTYSSDEFINTFGNSEQWEKIVNEEDLLQLIDFDDSSTDSDKDFNELITVLDEFLVPKVSEVFAEIIENPIFETKENPNKFQLILFSMFSAFELGLKLGEIRGYLRARQSFAKNHTVLNKKYDTAEELQSVFSSVTGSRKFLLQRESGYEFLRNLLLAEPNLSVHEMARRLNQKTKEKLSGFSREIPQSTARVYATKIKKENDNQV
jgi:hypothetical protein